MPTPDGNVARIDELRCIGCTLCLKACPFDAIVGAAQLMHTVLAAYCTGCALCLPPCPVDCIEMLPAAAPLDAAQRHEAKLAAKTRAQRRLARLRREEEERAARLLQAAEERRQAAGDGAAQEAKQQLIAAALARARAQRAP